MSSPSPAIPYDVRSGIERTLTPPVEVAHSQIGHIEAATVAETLGNSEGHPDRSTNPVPCCQAEQQPDYPLFEILHQVTFPTPDDRLQAAVGRRVDRIRTVHFETVGHRVAARL